MSTQFTFSKLSCSNFLPQIQSDFSLSLLTFTIIYYYLIDDLALKSYSYRKIPSISDPCEMNDDEDDIFIDALTLEDKVKEPKISK